MLYQTHVRVHLNNIKSNIESIRKAIGPERKILIAVKADGYGHGAVEVSKMAEKIGVDWLGVATVPEGIELRLAGVKMPILKFSPVFPEEMEEAINNQLVLAVCELENILQLNEVAKKCNRVVEVHLKIDTGMGRIGVQIDQAKELAGRILNDCPFIKLTGAMTHLPVSDEVSKTFTQRQIERFKKVVKEAEDAHKFKFGLVHCANSGGILGHPESWLDMVRPGIMLYGFYPSDDTPQTISLLPGLSFKTRVSFLKKVKKGCSVGYGRSWVAAEDSCIATFPAGYADGFNRLFSNSGRVLINGASYPVVGRVCMDQSMCNLGSETKIKVGDEVVLIGWSGNQNISAYEWAEKLGTITYEVTCQIGKRVRRFYDDY
ncbi:MAG: alanine racemase [Candidatus Riflebacteria bacterium]|nr:alanine racemase [Candidatus Riflebacteria bacterium]